MIGLIKRATRNSASIIVELLIVLAFIVLAHYLIGGYHAKAGIPINRRSLLLHSGSRMAVSGISDDLHSGSIAMRPIFHDYYQVVVVPNEPIIMCDDWSTTVSECWQSYVVFPHGTNGDDYDEWRLDQL